MDWKNKLEQSLNQGYDVSRKLFGKAKKRATELGEYGVLSLEVRQLETKHTELMTSLGGKVYELLVQEKRSTVTAKSQGVKELLEQIEETREELERKRHLLEQHEESRAAGTGERGEKRGEEKREKREEEQEESTGEERKQTSGEESREKDQSGENGNSSSGRSSEDRKSES
jgi:hypothetical protein